MRTILLISLSFIIGSTLIACGPSGRTSEPDWVLLARTSGSGKFNGLWNVTLKGRSDSCQLGMKGKSLPAKVIIIQNGRRATLTIEGFAKAFKGTVNGSDLKVSGTHRESGMSLSGTVQAKLTARKKISISSAALTIKSGKSACKVLFRGSGSRA